MCVCMTVYKAFLFASTIKPYFVVGEAYSSKQTPKIHGHQSFGI